MGVIEGACALLLGQPMYRLYSRQPAALADRGGCPDGQQRSPEPQGGAGALAGLHHLCHGFIRPPMLDYCQVRILL